MAVQRVDSTDFELTELSQNDSTSNDIVSQQDKPLPRHVNVNTCISLRLFTAIGLRCRVLPALGSTCSRFVDLLMASASPKHEMKH
jgi:hypothetical protein